MSKRKPKALRFRRGRRRPNYSPRVEAVESRFLLTTFTVEQSAYNALGTDNGSGTIPHTLSWAIDQVDDDSSNSQADTINFSFQGPGPFTISPTSELPLLTHPVDIDGVSSSNLDAAPMIVIDGSLAPSQSDGLTLAPKSDGSTITGLCISGFGSGAGIDIVSDRNLIEDNYLGTNNTGSSSVLDGNEYGIYLDRAAQNTIGGTASTNPPNGNAILSNGNLISGNTTGIDLHGSSTNLIEGNFIGTAISGTRALPNGTGVDVESMSTGNTIGGSTAVSHDQQTTILMGNVISGNLDYGVQIQNGGTSANVVEGNFIGVDASGGRALGNDFGVVIDVAATSNTIGGTSAAFRNIISGNDQSGIYIDGTDTNQNTVAGNYIGTDESGTVALPNTDGVLIDGGAQSNTIGAANVVNENGSIQVLEGNLISGNVPEGVYITGVGSAHSGPGSSAPEAQTAYNVLEGNLIGVNSNFLDYAQDPTVNKSLSNEVGVLIDDGALNNTIGAENVIGAGNVIGFNSVAGVQISGYQTTLNPAPVPPPFNTSNNVIEGSFIGTDATGLIFLGNQIGVLIDDGATFNTVGGSRALGNVISSNLGPGVDIRGNNAAQTSDNTVAGNFIGTDATGEDVISPSFPYNGLYNPIGVLLEAGASYNTIGGINDLGPDGRPLLTQGNLISGNPDAGVEISGSGSNLYTEHNVIEGNFIGTDADGEITLQQITIDTGVGSVSVPYRLGNGSGVLITAGQGGALYNTVGGTMAGARNVISGNLVSGVEITSAGGHVAASDNVIEGNYIGTDLVGVPVFGPGNVIGISIDTGAYDNTVGGTSAAARNLISGNTTGVDINGAAGDAVQGNFIGTDASGTLPVPNGVGVTIEGATSTYTTEDELLNGNTIGGMIPSARNVISGNTSAGVVITGGSAASNVVEGNYVGTAANGRSALHNGIGVLITAGASGNTVGGITQATGNVISGNTTAGVEILGFQSSNSQGSSSAQGTAPTGINDIEGNYIGTDSTGQIAVGNTVGVLLSNSPDNLIGSTYADAPNVISGNTSIGVEILGLGSTNDQLIGNFIGSDASGDNAFPSSAIFDPTKSVQQTGILINGSVGDYIGEAGEPRNLISGNVVGMEFTGITATPGETTTNTVTSNYVGIGNDQKALGNVIGIWVNNIPSTKIEGNTISGNSQGGVYISGADAKNNMVQGNKIGLGPDGQTYPATGHKKDPTYQFPIGVYIEGASSNMIGGTAAGARNTISGNSVGVYIYGAAGSSQGNTISGNAINSNERYGILLFNAPFNTNSRNQFARNGIANFREFSGPVASGGATQTSSSGTKAKKPARESHPAAHPSARRTRHAAALTVHGRQVPAGPIRKSRA